MTFLSSLLTLALLAPAHQDAPADGAASEAQAEAAVVHAQLPSYPLTTCLVSGEELGSMGESIDLVLEGRLLRLCCKGCVRKAKADPAGMIAKVDAAVVRAQALTYPLETCVLSDEILGSKGEPVDVVVGTRLVRLCCKGCKRRVLSNPTPHLAKVDRALIEAQLPEYPLTTCVVSGEELDAKAVNFLYGTRLARLCCKGCEKEFRADPDEHLAKIEAARPLSPTEAAIRKARAGKEGGGGSPR